MTKCVLCGQRKGRRQCPAKSAMICAQCCGQKRVLEIDCPERCEYLKIGRVHEAGQVGARHYRADDPAEQAKISRVLDQLEPVLVEMHAIIAGERRSSRDLTDADVAEAVDCLLATLRTEDKGVIYQTTSGNLRAESLRRQLGTLIEAFRYPKDPEQPRIPLKDASACLEVLRHVVASHMEAGPSSISFVDFLVRHLPRDSGIAPSAPSIIIP